MISQKELNKIEQIPQCHRCSAEINKIPQEGQLVEKVRGNKDKLAPRPKLWRCRTCIDYFKRKKQREKDKKLARHERENAREARIVKVENKVQESENKINQVESEVEEVKNQILPLEQNIENLQLTNLIEKELKKGYTNEEKDRIKSATDISNFDQIVNQIKTEKEVEIIKYQQSFQGKLNKFYYDYRAKIGLGAFIFLILVIIDIKWIKKFLGWWAWKKWLKWFYKPLDEEDWGWPEK